ncbi:MAG: hypothetical protein KDD48_02585 [Bdellovibrionales bacterium]|nr:hypothetical protein [Bdellovibrionales bacterium]
MKLRSKVGIAFLALVCFLSCNQAPTGFGAPTESTVEITGLSSTAPGDQDTYQVAIITVKVPSAGVLVPGNNIFVTVTCTECTLFDRASGESVTVADPARITEVINPYSFATNKDGVYKVVVKVENPSDLGKTLYTAKVVADIGVSVVETSITVGDVETSG